MRQTRFGPIPHPAESLVRGFINQEVRSFSILRSTAKNLQELRVNTQTTHYTTTKPGSWGVGPEGSIRYDNSTSNRGAFIAFI